MNEKCMGGPAPAQAKTSGLMLKLVPDDDPKTIPVGVRVAHALSSAALETNDPEVLSALGGLVALVPALPAIQLAAVEGTQRLVRDIMAPEDGEHLVINGVDLTKGMQRILGISEKPQAKKPAKKPQAKKPAKKPQAKAAPPAPKAAPRAQPKKVAR